MGMRRRMKKTDRTAKPFAARVLTPQISGCCAYLVRLEAYYNSVVPSKDGEFV
jgi:hypothetical protein